MALIMKLPNLDMVGKNKTNPRYRRRVPKEVQRILGDEWFQVHLKHKSGAKMFAEYDAIVRGFDKLVADARLRLNGDEDTRSAVERWHEALLKAEGMLEGVRGLDEYEARNMIKHDLAQRGEDPLVLKALSDPTAPPPSATLQDAINLYSRERVKEDKDKAVRLDRIVSRMVHVMGDMDKMNLDDLRRAHGHKVRDYLLHDYRQVTGKKLSVDSVSRELSIMSAIVNLADREMDLDTKITNPFSGLELPKSHKRKSEQKLPLPDDLTHRMADKLKTLKDNPALHLTWRLMAGTSAHAKEVALLELQDIDLGNEVLCIRANSLRGGLKTGSRDRDIPLVGDALLAAKEAVKGCEGGAATSPLFPRYSKSARSNDSLSGILKKHLDSLKTEKGHTTYGLRHRVAAKLRIVGAPQITIDRVLGHAIEAVGAATYGGIDDRREVDREWLKKAGL